MSRHGRPKILAPRPLDLGVEEYDGAAYLVRPVTGAAATKVYRCPGCDHEILPGTAHRVVWPQVGGGADLRRHWHAACWAARSRRAARTWRRA